jgi:hypothetical protein
MDKKKSMIVSQTYARILYINHPNLPETSRKVNYTDDSILIINLYDVIQYEKKIGKDEVNKKLLINIEYGMVSIMRNYGSLKRWQVRIY